MAQGKRYRQARELIKTGQLYSLEEAVKLLQETGKVKFDPTAELHINLNVDPKHPEQLVRGTLVLPHGSGKQIRVAALVTDDKVKAAKAAGADAAGLEDLIAEFETGKVNYDVIVAIPDVMKGLGKVAKTLGQKGLMPNLKSGTVTPKFEEAIRDLKRGKIEFRTDKDGAIHTIFGKLSFKTDQLNNNLTILLKAIRDAKPSGIKGNYIKNIHLASTMGPGVQLDVNQVMAALGR
ncbi:50S ribosomal protein L1 [Candidatus Peregrinibacteria bacterium]|nr:50S ribosomal protein L1 [Candidatus Peregrinibacteria bacterium]